MFEPFGNTTTLPATQWHPEPQFRGTLGILSSCLITMSLCIWTSLHLNLPGHKREYLQKYRKAVWLVLGLLAPELVVWNAWQQRKAVKELSALMEKTGFMPERLSMWKHTRKWFTTASQNIKIFLLLEAGSLPEFAEPKPHRPFNEHRHAWSDIHSWFVVMGGLAFEDPSPEDEQFMRGGRQRITLTPAGLKWMVNHRPHLIPDIPLEHILDKSKSDWLAKGLTCWQAGYFCVQCVFRLSQRLSITLLELNVFAHALCALLFFLIWWDKPRDVQEPMLITEEESLDICACFTSYQDRVWEAHVPEFRHVLDPPPLDQCIEITGPTTITMYRINDYTYVSGHYLAVRGHQRFRYLKVGSTYWELLCAPSWAVNFDRGGRAVYTITRRDIARLLRIYRAAQENLRPIDVQLRATYEKLASDRISNWTGRPYVLSNTRTWLGWYGPNPIWLLAGATFAGACYGGLHLIAWANQFPSYAEAVIWRAASVTLIATGPMATFIYEMSILSLEVDIRSRQHGGTCVRIAAFILHWLLFSIMLPLPLWYTLCLAFIVVECFILLAHIPESALRLCAYLLG